MTNEPPARPLPRYQAYLLRLWEVDSDGERIWRASLQDSHTGERRGFPDLAALAAFLAEQTGGPPNAQDMENPP